MKLVHNKWGLKCKWCGKKVSKVDRGSDPREAPTGICPDDGIDTIELDQ